MPISSSSASSTSPASPTRPILASTSLLRWLGSSVEWMMVLPFGIAMPNDGFRERAADAEDHVGLGEEFRHRARHRKTARAERQRMRLGKGRLAAEARRDGDGEPFGQPFQLRPGLGVMHALAGIDHRTLGADQQRGRFLHMHGIGAVAGAQHRRVVQGLRHLLVPHVGGNFDDHRSAAAVLQFGEGAAEDVADFGGEIDRLGRLGRTPSSPGWN